MVGVVVTQSKNDDKLRAPDSAELKPSLKAQDDPSMPPEGSHFRVYHPQHDVYIYCNSRNNKEVHVTVNSDVATEDQFFTFQSDGHSLFLRNVYENAHLISNWHGGLGHRLEFDDDYDDGQLGIDWHAGGHAGQFALIFERDEGPAWIIISGDGVPKCVDEATLKQHSEPVHLFELTDVHQPPPNDDDNDHDTDH